MIRKYATLFAVALGAAGTVTASAQTPAIPAPAPAPVQNPAIQVPDALHPRQVSPGAQELGGLIANKTLTIDDAVGIGLATSRNFATAVARLEQARGRTSEARAGLNPTLGANASVTLYDRDVKASLGGQSLVVTNQFNSVYSGVATLPLDLFGVIRSAINQAQFNEVAARIDVNRIRNETIFGVRNAFYNALRAQGQLVVAEDNLANANTRLQDAQVTLKAGTGTQFDVLTAQRDVADAQQSVVNARGQVTLALGQLKNTMGIDVSTPIRISDTGAVEEPAAMNITNEAPKQDRLHVAEDEVNLGPEYAAAVQEALQTRPELLEADAAISAAERGVRFARRSQLPSFAISANALHQPNTTGFVPENESYIQVTMSLPIFDGGLARARVRQARAEVASAQNDRRTTADQVTLDVQQAYVNLVQASERVSVANVGLTQAREAFRLSRLRAQVGVTASPQVSPQLELSNAQATLTQAETNRVNAVYDYNLARAQLDRAVGRYSYGEGAGYTHVPDVKITGTRPITDTATPGGGTQGNGSQGNGAPANGAPGNGTQGSGTQGNGGK